MSTAYFEPSAMGDSSAARKQFDVLGTAIDAIQIPDAILQMEAVIASGVSGRYCCAANVHTVIEAVRDVRFREVLKAADMVVADGMPLVWIGRLRGLGMARRVYGPELMLKFCAQSCIKGYRHFFYGGAPGVAVELAGVLASRFPGLRVAGAYSPGVRNIGDPLEEEGVAIINRAAPDVLWVGLGCPKQEWWMYEHRNVLQVPMVVGVGAAFDFCTGRVRQAPNWMRELGLEWLFRLSREPRRLWRRYLVYNTQFLGALGWQAITGKVIGKRQI